MPTSFKKTAAMLAAPAIAVLFHLQAQAGTFNYGNIAVLQEGDGVTALSTASSPVAILEFTPAGSLVQTISIPSSGGNRLVQSSVSASEGFLMRSVNSSNLTFVGYDAPLAVPNVPGTAAAVTNRVVGQVDLNGNFTRPTVSGVAFNGANIRSSATDGTNFWTAGTSSPASVAGGEGVWYSPTGGSWVQLTTASAVNARVVRIFNGKLYYSTAGAVSTFPTALPTAAATPTATGIASSSIYDFAINPAGNVAYVCDDGSAIGGLQKWTNNGTTWVKAFNFFATNGLTAGCRGLAVDFSGVNPVIFATTADASTKVIEITDTSALTAITNTTDRAVTVAVAGANFAYRGVALAPGINTAGAPVFTGISPATITNAVGSTAAFAATANGATPFSYFWYKEIPGASTNLIASATNEFLTFPSAALTDTASYQVVISNATTFTVTSSVVSLTITAAPASISGIAPVGITNQCRHLRGLHGDRGRQSAVDLFLVQGNRHHHERHFQRDHRNLDPHRHTGR